MGSPHESRPGGRFELVTVALVALAYAAPLLLTRYFPGLDLPWNAAIIEVLHRHDADEVSRDFLGYYVVDWRFFSYLTMYFAVDALAFVVGDVVIAMQLVIAAYVVAFVWSVRCLIRAFGGNGIMAVLAAPAAYSMAMEYGFLTYSLCYPMTFWLWTLVRELLASGPATSRKTAARLVAIALLSGLIAITHPFAAVVAAVGAALLVATHLDRATMRRAGLVAGCLLLGALPIFIAIAIIEGDVSSSPRGRLLEGASLWEKLRFQRFVSLDESLATAPVRLFGFIPAGCRFLLVAAGLSAAIVARYIAGRPRERGFRGRSLTYLLLLMVGIYLLTPFTFEWPRPWYGAQPRLLPIVWVVGLVLLRCGPKLDRPKVVAAPPLAVSAIALVLLVATSFLPFAREAADFRNVVERAAPRARTLGLIEQRPTVEREPASPWRHFAAYVFVERGGYVSNLPFTVSASGNAGVLTPVRLADDKVPWPYSVPLGRSRIFEWTIYSEGWDQFLIRDLDPAEPFDFFREHVGEVELIARSGRWRLYARKSPGEERR